MKTRLTSGGVTLLALGLVLTTETAANAQRPKRNPARSAVVRQPTRASVAPASAATVTGASTPVRSGVAVAAPASGASAPALEVAAGCVPAWSVEGRAVRRLPDRCPEPTARGTSPGPATLSSAQRADAASNARVVAASGTAIRPSAGAPAATLTTATAASPSAQRAAPRRRAPKQKPPANCARFRTWIDENGVRRTRPQCS